MSEKKPPEQLAAEDAIIYGTGFTRTHSDGRVEHIPRNKIFKSGQNRKTEPK